MAKVDEKTIASFNEARNKIMSGNNDNRIVTDIGIWIDTASKKLTELQVLRYIQNNKLKESRDGVIMLANEIANEANLENPLVYAKKIKRMNSTKLFLEEKLKLVLEKIKTNS